MLRPTPIVALLAGAIGLFACSSGAVPPDAPPPECSELLPCPTRYVCQEGSCVLADAGGGGPGRDLPSDSGGRDVLRRDVPRDQPSASPDADGGGGEDRPIGLDLAPDLPAGCSAPVDCADPGCENAPCGPHGQVCQGGSCICPGGQATETSCGDGEDNDCDGLIDCADPDCNRKQCGSRGTDRCCGGACRDTLTDTSHCGGCDFRCDTGQTCRTVTDADGTRGHCTCSATSMCSAVWPGSVCRNNPASPPDQNLICACTDDTGCGPEQTCRDVPGANFCSY